MIEHRVAPYPPGISWSPPPVDDQVETPNIATRLDHIAESVSQAHRMVDALLGVRGGVAEGDPSIRSSGILSDLDGLRQSAADLVKRLEAVVLAVGREL